MKFPAFKRRAASTRRRYVKDGLCPECGAGVRQRGKRFVIAAHHPNCPALKKIVSIEKRGICAQCGATKNKRKGWDEQMQMVVETEACPNGHSHGMKWRPPTKADIQELGLRKVVDRPSGGPQEQA